MVSSFVLTTCNLDTIILTYVLAADVVLVNSLQDQKKMMFFARTSSSSSWIRQHVKWTTNCMQDGSESSTMYYWIALKVSTSRISSSLYVVINLQQQAYSLCGEFNSTGGDQKRLHYLFFQNVRDQALQNASKQFANTMVWASTDLSNINACIPLPKSMSISQLRHNCNGIQSSIFSKCGRNHFQGIGICLETISLHPLERLRVLWE